jgi:hypothetical protein
MLFVSRRQYQTRCDRIDPSRFFRPHRVCATVIGGEDESPGCIRFRYDNRSVALLFKKNSRTGDRLSGGVQNSAFDSHRKVRGRILLECCRARQTHERGNQYGESPTSLIPCSSSGAPQFVPAIYHLDRILFSAHKLTHENYPNAGARILHLGQVLPASHNLV